MAKTHGQVDTGTGRIETKKMGRGKEVDFPVTIVNTKIKRAIRALVG